MRSSVRGLLVGFALGVLAHGGPVSAQAEVSEGSAGPGEPSAREREELAVALKRVSEELICQCGCNMILSECSHQNCPFALPQRKKILEQVAAGKSDQDIIAGYVASYGRSILSAPPTEGHLLDRLAWVAPFAALGLGLLMLVVFVRRFTAPRRLPQDQREPSSSAPELAAAAEGDPWRARVERDLGPGAAGKQR